MRWKNLFFSLFLLLPCYMIYSSLTTYRQRILRLVNIEGLQSQRIGTPLLTKVDRPECRLSDSTTDEKFFTLGNQVRPKFLPYKNPCWQQGDKTMCIPYVYLAGFPKCGTTDLHYRIKMHPEIISGWKKEPHFVTRMMYKRNEKPDDRVHVSLNGTQMKYNSFCRMKKIAKGDVSCQVKNYAYSFFDTIGDIIKKNRSRGEKEPVIIDSSASTAWDNMYWNDILISRNCSSIFHMAPAYLARVNPMTRFIMILRDPLERAYSDYLIQAFLGYAKDKGDPKESFHNRTVQFLKSYSECQKERTEKDCAYLHQYSWYGGIPGRHALGLYHFYISEYLSYFPRHQLLLIKSEDYRKDMAKEFRRIFQFLGVSPASPVDLMKMSQTVIKSNKTPGKKKIGDMLPKTRKLLEDFYQPHNDRLADVVLDKDMTWKYSSS